MTPHWRRAANDHERDLEERLAAARVVARTDAAPARSGSCARRDAICPSTARRARGPAVFSQMCTNPEIACEITLQPVDRFPLDAAILFSDILTIPHAMNLGLGIRGRRGPEIRTPGAHRRRHRQARRAGSGHGAEVRDRCGGAGPPRTGRPSAADRLRGQSLDGGDLHGGGRRQQDLRPHQAHDVRVAARSASAARDARARPRFCI